MTTASISATNAIPFLLLVYCVTFADRPWSSSAIGSHLPPVASLPMHAWFSVPSVRPTAMPAEGITSPARSAARIKASRRQPSPSKKLKG